MLLLCNVFGGIGGGLPPAPPSSPKIGYSVCKLRVMVVHS